MFTIKFKELKEQVNTFLKYIKTLNKEYNEE